MTSIAQERSGLAVVGQRLRTREQWGSRYDYTNARSVTEPATRVFVHISVTTPSNYASDDAHARAVESIGISRFPATGISYNRLFFRSGTASEGQPLGRRGAHTVNDFEISTCTRSGVGCPGRGGPLTAPGSPPNLNYNARAYVICQNVQHTVTDPQLDALARAIAADMLAGFVTRTSEIHGHRCVSSKSCPGNPMWARMGELRKLVDHYLTNGSTTEDDMFTDDDRNKLVRTWQLVTQQVNHHAPDDVAKAVWEAAPEGNAEEIAAALAPLLIPHLPGLNDTDLAKIATAVADEQHRRQEA
ncbi:MAG: N-acetylmuramoyl-L-alanine amidase [Gammaproteobacteria bacterium]